MHANVVIRVFCIDGPCHGLQYLDLDTGRILFDDGPDGHWYIYRVSDDEIRHTDFGPSPVAHFDHAEPADEPLPQPNGAEDG
jgi:hypothetical protein